MNLGRGNFSGVGFFRPDRRFPNNGMETIIDYERLTDSSGLFLTISQNLTHFY